MVWLATGREASVEAIMVARSLSDISMELVVCVARVMQKFIPKTVTSPKTGRDEMVSVLVCRLSTSPFLSSRSWGKYEGR